MVVEKWHPFCNHNVSQNRAIIMSPFFDAEKVASVALPLGFAKMNQEESAQWVPGRDFGSDDSPLRIDIVQTPG